MLAQYVCQAASRECLAVSVGERSAGSRVVRNGANCSPS